MAELCSLLFRGYCILTADIYCCCTMEALCKISAFYDLLEDEKGSGKDNLKCFNF
jgi:hypothetical protein